MASMVALFMSCQKEGVFHPSKKISSITASYNTGGKTIQDWTWGKKNLEKIATNFGGLYYSEDVFSYDKNDRLVSISNGQLVYEYQYDGNKLKQIDLYYRNDLDVTYVYTYTNDKVTRVDETYYVDKKGDHDFDRVKALQFIMDEGMAKFISKADQVRMTTSDIKGDSFKGVYELTWENGNIVKVVSTSDLEPNEEWVYEAKYDNKNNPYYGTFWRGDGALDFFLHSKNNATEISWKHIEMGDMVDSPEVIDYKYTYDGSYPISVRSVAEGTLVEYDYLK